MKLTGKQILEQSYERWDLEVDDTHNFVAEGVVVHNSNGRFCWAKNPKTDEFQQFCGSRTNWLGDDETNIWWMALRQNPKIGVWCQNNPEKVIYGEVFGRVQKMTYGAKVNEIFFAAFAIMDKNGWLDYEDFANSAKESGVSMAPLLYKGPFDPKMAYEMAEQDSSWQNTNHLREGVVVLPVKERRDRKIGRVCLKIVSNRYLEKN